MSNSKIRVQKNVAHKNKFGEEETLLKGNFADANVKTSIPVKTVGVNLGLTVNMGNFESIRIDVWSSDKVQKFETRQDAIFRVANELSSALLELKNKYAEG